MKQPFSIFLKGIRRETVVKQPGIKINNHSALVISSFKESAFIERDINDF